MKKSVIISLVFCVGLLICTNSAFAQTFSISAGIPIQYTIDDFDGDGDFETDGMPVGTMFHFSLPGGLGFGYENYTQTIAHKYSQNPPSGSSSCYWGSVTTACKWNLENTMYDIFYAFDLTIVNLAIGAGIGETKITLDQGDWESSDGRKVENAKIQQYYFQLGYPVIPTIDIHLSYHAISTREKGKIKYGDSFGGYSEEVDPGGTLLALGLMVSF